MIKNWILLIGVIICIEVSAQIIFAESQESPSQPNSDGKNNLLSLEQQEQNIISLQESRKSGKPTLALFYYSVACSCTAARCAIATASIDSIPQLSDGSESPKFFSIDAYAAPEAESLFNLMIMPAVVYYDSTGTEINRLEWGMNRETITNLIKHPEIIQKPID